MNASCEAEPVAASDRARGTSAGLDRICAELHVDRETAAEFAANFLALLPSRLERIDRELDILAAAGRNSAVRAEPGPAAVVQLNIDPAVVALLSLDASAVMLGAFELSLTTQRLRRDIQTGRMHGLAAPRQELHDAAERLETELITLVDDAD